MESTSTSGLFIILIRELIPKITAKRLSGTNFKKNARSTMYVDFRTHDNILYYISKLRYIIIAFQCYQDISCCPIIQYWCRCDTWQLCHYGDYSVSMVCHPGWCPFNSNSKTCSLWLCKSEKKKMHVMTCNDLHLIINITYLHSAVVKKFYVYIIII